MFSVIEKKFIKDLAFRSIDFYFKNQRLLIVNETELPTDRLKKKLGCFVTLTIGDELRGCIGHIEAIQPLYLDIIENSVAAAFEDPRFPPLSETEINDIEIEFSVLSAPQLVSFTNSKELLQKLHPGIDGVIIRRGNLGATYLPQVWNETPNKEAFLGSLCEKAGLPSNDWEKSGIEVLTYQAEVIK
jgi:AmmeMemoRadiSam system protein A